MEEPKYVNVFEVESVDKENKTITLKLKTFEVVKCEIPDGKCIVEMEYVLIDGKKYKTQYGWLASEKKWVFAEFIKYKSATFSNFNSVNLD